MSDNNPRCDIILDLLPLYVDSQLSESTSAFVEEHLQKCPDCRNELENYLRPIFHNEQADAGTERDNSFRKWIRKIAVSVLLLFFLTGIGLAGASFYAGRHLALRDADFHRAEEMGLFTEVNSTQKLGNMNIMLDRVLFDTTRTTVFYRVNPEVNDISALKVSMTDGDGNKYSILSTKGYRGKHFIAEFEPVKLNVKKVNFLFSKEDVPGSAGFNLEVDNERILVVTDEIRPHLKKVINDIRVDIEEIILGATETQVKYRAIWPLTAGIRGIGFGLDAPMGAVQGPDGPRSASVRVWRFRASDDGPGIYDFKLYDAENRRNLNIEQHEMKTDSESKGIIGTLSFEPLIETTEKLQLTLPPVYVYYLVENPPSFQIEVGAGEEIKLNKEITCHNKRILLQKVMVADKSATLQYKLHDNSSHSVPKYLPEFVLVDERGFTREGFLERTGTTGEVLFRGIEKGKYRLQLKSLGNRLDEPFKFNISL